MPDKIGVLTSAALIVALSALTACAPWPHVEYTRPQIVGRLVDDGSPIAGAELFLSAKPGTNDPCNEVGESVSVSPLDGSFRIPERASTVLLQSLLNPPSRTMHITAVCIRRPDSAPEIGALLMEFIDKPVDVSLDCDVSKPGRRNGEDPAQGSRPLAKLPLCKADRTPRAAG